VWKSYLCFWEVVLVRHNYSYVLVSCTLYWMFTKGNYVRATMQPGIVLRTAGHLQDSHPIIHLCMPHFYGWTTWTASAYTQERSPRRHGPVEFLVLSSERDANEIDARSLSSTDMTASRSELCIKNNENEVSSWDLSTGVLQTWNRTTFCNIYSYTYCTQKFGMET
jgi:hypothetical protein